MMRPKNLIIFSALLLLVYFAIPHIYAQETHHESIKSETEYFKLLTESDSTTFIHEFEYPFFELLNDFQSEYYNSLQSIEAKKEYIKLYWNRENPNPLDTENLWLSSFVDRYNYVKKYFSRDKPPYFDDRGRYYLKWGKPKLRLKDHRTVVTVLYSFGIIQKRPEEAWSYENISQFLIVYFRKNHSYFEELTPFQAYGGLNPKFQERIAKNNAPIAIVDPESEERSLPFTYDVSQFRGPEGSIKIESSFLVPIKEIHGYIDSPSTDSLSIQYSSLLRDLEYNPIISTQSLHAFPIQSSVREGLKYATNSITLFTPPLIGELTLQVKNNETGHLGYTKNIVNIRNFQGGDLMISDIRLFKEVTTTDQRIVLPSSVKGGFYAAPYPFPEIQKSEPLLLYFEVYNTVEDGSSEEYTLEISVDWDESRENLARKFFDFLTRKNKYSIGRTDTRITNRNTTMEAIQFDLSSLRNGPYILSVTISDVSNNNKVTSSKKIMIDN